MNIDYQCMADDRPKISNGSISTMRHPIHFVFGSRVGFSGTVDLMALFLVWVKFKMAAGGHFEKFQIAMSL